MQRSLLLVAAVVLCGLLAGGAQAGLIITGASDVNGESEGVAVTGDYFADHPDGDVGEYTVPTFGEEAICFTDRDHEYNGQTAAGLPPYLVGGDYIMTANDARSKNPYTLNFTLDQPAYLYVVRDSRFEGTPPAWFSDGAGLDLAPVMSTWGVAHGFYSGDKVGYDESGVASGTVGPGVGINVTGQVYMATDTSTGNALLAAGPYEMYQSETTGANMYGVVASLTAAEPGELPELPAVPSDYVVLINFEIAASPDRNRPNADVYLPDMGDEFGDRGNGHEYGWLGGPNTETRNRGSGNYFADLDERFDSLNHVAKDVNGTPGMQEDELRTWEISLPNGVYDLFIVCGDPDNIDSDNSFDVEGVLVTDATPKADNFDMYELLGVAVLDGRLTVTPTVLDGNAKLMYIDILPEPATLALLGLGLGGLLLRRKR